MEAWLADPAKNSMNMLARIGLWFGSMLVSVAAFSLVLSIVWNAGVVALPPVFRITMIFALPVACLYLPVVLFFKDAEGRRGRVILLSATLVGPTLMVLWCLLPEGPWKVDPLLGICGLWGPIYALFVGFLTACSYVGALKLLCHRSNPKEVIES